MRRDLTLRKYLIGLALLLGSMVALAAPTEFRMISLQHRFAKDVLPVIESMVGPEGKVSALDNHLMVTATPEQLEAIEQVLAKLDVERRTWRITIGYDDQRDRKVTSAGVRGRVRAGDIVIGTDAAGHASGAGDVRIEIDQRSQRQATKLTQFLSVTDGEQAFIRVGQSIPYTQQWLSLTQRHVHLQQSTRFHDITTGFVVRPRSIGNEVELAIAPRIADLGSTGVVDFQALQTTVRVLPGQWFDLGGAMQSRDEVSRSILEQGDSEDARGRQLMIRID